MSITFDADDPRTIAALQLAASAGQWLHCQSRAGQERGFGVPSAADPNRYHLVSCARCDCPDFRPGARGACVHVLAVRLHAELVRAMQPPAPSNGPARGRRGHLRLVASG